MAAGKTAKKLSTGIGVNPVTAHIPQRRLNNGGCCMKNVFFISVFILISATLVLAQQGGEGEFIYTPEGEYYCTIEYIGKNCGRQTYEDRLAWHRSDPKDPRREIYTNIKLTNAQWGCINKMLNRYQSSRGDTFFVYLTPMEKPFSYSIYSFFVYCEFTSDTQYNYWVFHLRFPS
jgi:hypothetical protein